MILPRDVRFAMVVTIALTLQLPGIAEADGPATATVDVNMRTGPSTSDRRIFVIPSGGRVEIDKCIDNYRWRDARYDGRRGWIYAKYLRTG